jgi:AhpD family alkylhydroperoxidase
MEPRSINLGLASGAYQSLLGLESYLHASTLPPVLMHLVKLRASQINGCAYCIDMHWKDLRALGESESRLYQLNAWRESPGYTDQERAALDWCEAITAISKTHADDEIYQRVKPHFTDKELTDLTVLVATINAWNRLAIPFRNKPGTYQSKLTKPK